MGFSIEKSTVTMSQNALKAEYTMELEGQGRQNDTV